jgi:DNA-binding SARP family transcriptional activator
VRDTCGLNVKNNFHVPAQDFQVSHLRRSFQRNPLRRLRPRQNTVPRRQIRLFGNFEFVIDGKPLRASAWERASAKALFKYLVVHHRKTFRYDALMDKLAELGVGVSEKQFYNALSVIRKILNYAPNEPYGLLSANKLYTLNFGEVGKDYTLDIEQFSSYIKEAHQTASSARKTLLYEQALAVYRGNLLDEDIDADYLTALRDDFRDDATEAELYLATRALDNRDDDAAITFAKHILERDSLHEKASMIILRAHLRRDELGAATRFYERLEKLYRTDLQTAPPLALQQLVKPLMKTHK